MNGLPPGFDLDQEQGTPPAGFELDQPSEQPMTMGGLGRNAVQDVGRQIQGLGDAGVAAGKTMFQMATAPSPFVNPREFVRTVKQTPVGQSIRNMPSAVADAGSRFMQHPVQSMYESPVTTAMVAYGATRPPIAAGKALFAGERPNFLERAGAKGINASMEIRPKTIERMAKSGQNPGDVGIDTGMQLGREGFAGKGPVEGYKQAQTMANKYGSQIDSALANIKKANRFLGEYPELEDSLKVDSNKLLKPMLDRANELRESAYPTDKMESRFQRAAYDSLSKASEKKGGFIELDDVRAEMKKVGNMMNAAGEQHLPVVKKLYHQLADIQDSMIDDIAERSGDPKLSQALRDANANYSRYARIIPDIKKASAKEGTGASPLFKGELMKAAGESIQPRFAQAAYMAGRGARKLFSPVNTEGLTRPLSNQKGALFPEKEQPPVRPSELQTPSEEAYRQYQNNYDRYAANDDWQNVLQAKWGMLRNARGN